MPLSEQAHRRPDFQAGFAVELADGQKWTIPPVKFRFFPGDDGDLHGRPWYGGDLEDDIDILFGIEKAPEGMLMPYVAIPLRMAAALLAKNYDLPPRAVGNLLSYIPGDPQSEELLTRVSRAVLGRDPDASEEDDETEDPDPKGDGSDGTPTSGGSE